MTRVGWDRLAVWRDFRMGEGGDLWHRAILDPAFSHAEVAPHREAVPTHPGHRS